MKIRIPLIIKNIALTATYTVGAALCVGFVATGAFATTKKDWVKEQITTVTTTLDNVSSTLSDTNTTLGEFKDGAQNTANKLSNNEGGIISKLNEIKSKLDSISSSDSSINDISTQIQQIISQIQGINIENINSEIDSTYDQVNELIGENGTVTKTLSNVNDTIKKANSDGSQEWQYYDLVAKILIAIGTVLISIIILGTILLFACYKRVDGVYISRSSFKKKLLKHVETILKKNPDLVTYLESKYRSR